MEEPLLSVKDLKTHCFTRAGVVKAVDGVSFSLARGEALGLVGESGSGKSMTCNAIVRLASQPGTRTVAGSIEFEGEDLLKLSRRRMRAMRGGKIAMILQDPLMSLNPAFTIGNQIVEAFHLHAARASRGELRRRVLDIMRQVSIPTPEERLRQYPFQFSGGMRQRAVAAMALAPQPSLLIADEPTTALDVTTQDQFLRLLKNMQSTHAMAMILVTHDLGIVAQTCDRVAVMYAGRIVESGTVSDVLASPAHPYTEALLRALPRMGHRTRRLFQIDGDPPNLMDLPSGCTFLPRCPKAMPMCMSRGFPPTVSFGEGRQAACWRIAPQEPNT